MKRLPIALLVAFVATAFLAAEESMLIDFTELGADVVIDPDSQTPTDNEATLIDFSDVAGFTFSADELALMKTSLALGNWEVLLAPSARTVENENLSRAVEVITGPGTKPFYGEKMADKKLLGVRVHFPDAPFNSWAMLRPPFEIPAYEDKTEFDGSDLIPTPAEEGKGDKFDGFGVVKNVGVLKSVAVTLYGSNFPHGVGIVLANELGEEQHIFLGYMNFDGWRTITWTNPHYITEVRNRSLARLPLYPTSHPFVKLLGIMVYKDASQAGGDVFAYFKDIKITFDLAVLDLERDISEEEIWGVLKQRQRKNKIAAFKKLGEVQVLRYYERQRMHDVVTPSDQN